MNNTNHSLPHYCAYTNVHFWPNTAHWLLFFFLFFTKLKSTSSTFQNNFVNLSCLFAPVCLWFCVSCVLLPSSLFSGTEWLPLLQRSVSTGRGPTHSVLAFSLHKTQRPNKHDGQRDRGGVCEMDSKASKRQNVQLFGWWWMKGRKDAMMVKDRKYTSCYRKYSTSRVRTIILEKYVFFYV